MSRVWVSLIGLLVLAVAGCAQAGASATNKEVRGPASAGSYRVYLHTVQDSAPALAVVTIPGGKRDFISDSVLSPDGSVAYTLAHTADNTVVTAIESASGRELGRQTVSGSYELPTPDVNPVPRGLSANGRWLVLERQSPGLFMGTPTPPQTTRFAVLNTDLRDQVEQFELDGYFRFDAIDDGGRFVYVLESTPGSALASQVRRFHIGTRALNPAATADSTKPGQMTAVRLSALYSPDGRWHLGLYARNSGAAFLQVLPLSADAPSAISLDLPGKDSDMVAQMAWSAALAGDGKHLYLANDQLGEVAELAIPTGAAGEGPQIVRRGSIAGPTAFHWPGVIDAEAKELSGQRLVLSPDGQTLYLASMHGIYVIDVKTLSVRSRWLDSTPFGSLISGPDGRSLFGAVLTGTAELEQIDARSGSLLAQVTVPLTVLGLERASVPRQ